MLIHSRTQLEARSEGVVRATSLPRVAPAMSAGTEQKWHWKPRAKEKPQTCGRGQDLQGVRQRSTE